MRRVEEENKKIVVLFARAYHPQNSGFANASLSLARSIAQIPGYRVVVITMTDIYEQDLDDKNIKVLRANRDGGLLVKVVKISFVCSIFKRMGLSWLLYWIRERAQYKLAQPYLRNDNFKLAFLETNIYPFLGLKLVRNFPYQTAIRLHATEDTEILVNTNNFPVGSKWLRDRIFQFCKECRVVTSTTNYYIDFFKKNILNENDFYIWNKIYYGILPNTVLSVDEKLSISNIREEFQLLEPGSYCFTLGRMNDDGWVQKGFEDLLHALHDFKIKNTLKRDFKIIVVGSGNAEFRFTQLVKNLDLKEYVHHIQSTNRDETQYLLQNAKFVVLPSRFEGQSMFLTEAIKKGAPLVTTTPTGASDLVDEENNGILVQRGSVSELSNAINSMWNKNGEAINRMSVASKDLYEKNFSEKNVQDEFVKIIAVSETYT